MANYKIGDRYVDGEYTYEVIKVYENGTCEAQRVDKFTKANVKKEGFTEVKDVVKSSVSEEKAITEPNVNFTKTQVNRMPNAELEKVCNQLGIKVGTGTEMKRAIIDKLGL